MSVKLRNLTGAPLTIRTESRDINFGIDGPAPDVLFASGELASLPVDLGEESDVAVRLEGDWGNPVRLPEQEKGVLLIVPEFVSNHKFLAERCDLVCPGQPVFDAENRIEAYNCLIAGVGLVLALTNPDVVEAAQRSVAAEELMDGLAETTTSSDDQLAETKPSGKGRRRRS